MLYIALMLSLIFGFIASQIAKWFGKDPSHWRLMGFIFGFFAIITLFYILHKEQKIFIKKQKKESPKSTLSIPDASDVLWYFVCRQKQQNGPLSFAALSKEFENGNIDLSTFVWNEKMQDWKKINELIVNS